MSMALKATGRDIVYSVASCGEGEPAKWARAIGAHMYRSTNDIQDCFESIRRGALSQLDFLSESAIGCYNDPDMLTVGMHGKGYAANGGCTIEEYWTHFGIWCMYSVPLMIGADIRNLDAETKALLLNKDLIFIKNFLSNQSFQRAVSRTMRETRAVRTKTNLCFLKYFRIIVLRLDFLI